MSLVFALLTSFAFSVLVTPLIVSVLEKRKVGDLPGGRKIHKKFTPSMGGMGIVFSAFLSLSIWGWHFPLPDIRFLLGAISLMFFVGFRDDLLALKASHKLAGQLVSVLLVVVGGDIRIQGFYGFLGIDEISLFFSYFFSAFVILALTNAFNLIDGIDGLAGTIATVIFTLLGVWFYFQGLESYSLLCFTMLGAILGFLIFNWHPAKLFMGDTGSLTLGFSLGSLIVVFMNHNFELSEDAPLKFMPSFSLGAALMIIPLYDMARVFIKRMLKGKHPMSADKSHIHHFLLKSGFEHPQISLLLGFTQVIFILLVLLLGNFPDNVVMVVLSFFAIYLGFSLDLYTVKSLRKKIINSPRIVKKNRNSKRKSEAYRNDFDSLRKLPLN